ncbi:hypothetical protein N9V83_03720 [Flavobacteriales bacterium]|jgi:hypoxanthine phosphoribosyltransferase|nr:hypothetical protein [Flavobacteriales bacterium]
MKDAKAKDIIQNIIKEVESNGVTGETLVSQLQELRTFAQKDQDPLTIKVIRLAYQYLEENEAFDLIVTEEEYVDDEGNVIQPETPEMTDEENLINFVSLLKNTENEYNREDLQAYRDLFYEAL